MPPEAPRSLLELVRCDAASVPQVFEARVRRTPHAPFLLWQDQRWSYQSAWRACVAFAGFVQARNDRGTGVPRVATYLANGPQAMWSWLGTMAAGGVLVPLNRGHKQALLRDQLARAQASVLITDAQADDELPTPAELRAMGYRTLVRAGGTPPMAGYAGIECLAFADAADTAAWRGVPDLAPTQTACVMFTSGTTGRSKGVCVPHNQYGRGAARLVDAFGLGAHDVFHNWLPLFHLGGQLHMTMTAVIAGGSVALFPTFSTTEFARQVRSTRASVLCGFATILHFMKSLPPEEGDCGGSLRVGIFAGVPPELKADIEGRFGIRLGENYGMTEADPITAPEPGVEPPAGSCGRAVPEFELRVVDPAGQALAAGELGEIAVRPRVAGVMFSHYEGDNPGSGRGWRDGWFHTGDFGTLDAQGFLSFRGRSSAYIRRRGENVSVEELCALFMQRGDIAECIAVAVPSEVGEDEIKFVFVPAAGAVACTPAALLAWARGAMARFMVPRYWQRREALPRTDVGKVQLAALKDLGADVWDSKGAGGGR